jgi:lipoprotein-releasing system permease protein
VGDDGKAVGAGSLNLNHGSATVRNRMLGFLLYRFFVSSWIRKRTRSQAAIGVVLPILGVSVGVASFTIVLSIMGGFVNNLKQRLLGVESHIDIIRADSFGYIDANERLIRQVAEMPGVLSVSPFQTGDSILQSATRPITITIIGVDPQHADVFGRFASTFERGVALDAMMQNHPNDDDGQGFPGVVLGDGVARALNVTVGDRVTFVGTSAEEGAFGLAPKQWPAMVIDVFETGSARYDGKVVLTSLDFANRFFDVEKDRWAGLQVLVDHPQEPERVVGLINKAFLTEGLRAKPWTEANAALLRALRLERWGMSFVLYMVILVGCFTIAITLVLSVRRKAREMAILRAMGLARYELGRIYLLQGLFIGAVGVVLGLVTGLLVLHLLSAADLPWLTGAYSGRPFPVLVDVGDCVRVVVGSLVLAALASFWPAWEVMKIDVVETLSDRV